MNQMLLSSTKYSLPSMVPSNKCIFTYVPTAPVGELPVHGCSHDAGFAAEILNGTSGLDGFQNDNNLMFSESDLTYSDLLGGNNRYDERSLKLNSSVRFTGILTHMLSERLVTIKDTYVVNWHAQCVVIRPKEL